MWNLYLNNVIRTPCVFAKQIFEQGFEFVNFSFLGTLPTVAKMAFQDIYLISYYFGGDVAPMLEKLLTTGFNLA